MWWVACDPAQGGERPAVVLSADGLNRVRRTIVVVPLSTGPIPRPTVVLGVPSADSDAVAVCDQMRAVEAGVRAVLGL